MAKARPLVTLIVISYNQEAYIRPALAAAFSQTYSPLSIEISDDASTDGTFKIIESVCANYFGPHNIIFTKNSINLGLISHLNFVNQRAKGELIVISAGDDISIPERVERIVEAYVRGGFCSHYFFSLVRSMDESGELGGSYQSPGATCAKSRLRSGLASYPLAIGASQAYTKYFIDAFPPMNHRLWAEDQIYGFRGILLGPVTYINEALVNYRSTGISNARRRWSLRQYISNQINVLAVYRQRASDAFFMRQSFLGVIILLKLTALTVFFPMSPILSILRRWKRKR